MKKILSIVGPTAVGKTALAFEIAKKINGSLINVDSVQIYKGLDIIAGKDIPQESPYSSLENNVGVDSQFSLGSYEINGVNIYLLDVVPPQYEFNVADFCSLAPRMVEYVEKLQNTPILVGGTGYYLNSLLTNVDTLRIPQNKELRKKLESLEVVELQSRLMKTNPERLQLMNNSDRNNKRRLVRAIEVSESKGIIGRQEPPLKDFSVLTIGLKAPRELLKAKIDGRIEKRIEAGAFEEAENLFKGYDELSPQVRHAIGYKEIFGYLNKEYSKDEAVEKWRFAEYQNAKKQMTWFFRNKEIFWFDITESGFEDKAIETSKLFLDSPQSLSYSK